MDTNSRIVSKAAVIIAVLALLLGAVVVINTMAMAVIERRREFGVLAAVGWSRLRIARLILGETMTVSLTGAAVGIGLDVLASELVVRALAAATFIRPTSASGCWPEACSSGSPWGARSALLRLAGPTRAAPAGDQPMMSPRVAVRVTARQPRPPYGSRRRAPAGP